MFLSIEIRVSRLCRLPRAVLQPQLLHPVHRDGVDSGEAVQDQEHGLLQGVSQVDADGHGHAVGGQRVRGLQGGHEDAAGHG